MSADQRRDFVYCFECGEEINPKAEICPECGVRQPIDEPSGNESAPGGTSAQSDEPTTCGSCDERIEMGTLTCPHCGYSARSNMRKRGILIALLGLGISITGYGLIIGIPLLVWAIKRGKKATKVTAAYTDSNGEPFKVIGF